MHIKINGQTKEWTKSSSLNSLISELMQGQKVVAEVNGTIIKRPDWERVTLKNGDEIELVTLVGGG